MKISAVKFDNFKGRNGSYGLGPVTLVAGANFTNKTTIPLAIRLGMAGKLPPPIGARNIYDLAGNPDQPGQMAISLEFDAGRRVDWKWTRNAKGSVATEGGITADVTMPEMALDPRLFFGKTQAERVETIFSVCSIDAGTFDPQNLKRQFSAMDHPPTEVREKVLLEVFDRMDQTPRKDVAAWFITMRDWLKTEASNALVDYKRASGAFAAFRVNETLPAKDESAQLAETKNTLAQMQTGQQVDHGITKERIRALYERAGAYEKPEHYEQQIAALNLPSADVFDEDEIQLRHDELSIQTAQLLATSNTAEMHRASLACDLAMLEKTDQCPVCKASSKNWRGKAIAEIEAKIADQVESADKARVAHRNVSSALAEVKLLSDKIFQRGQLQAKKAALTTLLDEIARLEETVKEPTPEDISRSADIAGLREKIAALEANQVTFAAYQSDRTRKLELEQSLLAASCRVETFKGAAKLLTEAQSTIIDSAFGAVLKVAKHFTDGLLNSPIEFLSGELGRRVSQRDVAMGCSAPIGAWIPFAAFSGTEELLALAGFAVALTAKAPVKLVILDEMGRLDAPRKADVALRMLSLADSGIIDQAILLDVSMKDYAGITRPGFVKIQL